MVFPDGIGGEHLDFDTDTDFDLDYPNADTLGQSENQLNFLSNS